MKGTIKIPTCTLTLALMLLRREDDSITWEGVEGSSREWMASQVNAGTMELSRRMTLSTSDLSPLVESPTDDHFAAVAAATSLPNAAMRLRVEKLIEHATTLVELTLQLPAGAGLHYQRTVREAVSSTLSALRRLPGLWLAMREQGASRPAAFLWNQTLRIRDLPDHCVNHLLVRWERWTCQLREALEEMRFLREEGGSGLKTDAGSVRIESVEVEAEAEGGEAKASPMMLSEPPEEADEEQRMLSDCQALARLSRSLMKKIKARCILTLDPGRAEDVQLVDALYESASDLVLRIDYMIHPLMLQRLVIKQTRVGDGTNDDSGDWTTTGRRGGGGEHSLVWERQRRRQRPPPPLLVMMGEAMGVARAGIELARLAGERTSAPWFSTCAASFDELLYPVLERNPIR